MNNSHLLIKHFLECEYINYTALLNLSMVEAEICPDGEYKFDFQF